MQRARQVRVVYRDPYAVTLGKILKNKLVLASMVLMVLGVMLLASSYQSGEIVHSKFIQSSTVTSINGTYSNVYFVQPAMMNVTVMFSMPSNSIAFYKLYGVNNYSSDFHAKTSTFYVSNGYISNGSTLKITKIAGNEGQKYLVMVQSVGSEKFPVKVGVSSNIFLKEPSQKNIGGPGVIIGMVGSILLAARMSLVYKNVKGF